MLSKIKFTWINSVFYPDNKCIQIFDSESFKKYTGKIITYKGNSNTLQLTYDSTRLCNKLQCVSTAKDGSDDNKPLSTIFNLFTFKMITVLISMEYMKVKHCQIIGFMMKIV